MLAADALEGSIFRMLRQGQRVNFELDADGRATQVRIGSEPDMGLPTAPGLSLPAAFGGRTGRRVVHSSAPDFVRGGARRGARASPTPNRVCSTGSRRWPSCCQPDAIHWFDGSDAEHELLCKQLVDAGTFAELDPAKRPGLVLGAHRPERRRPGRGPHLHLLRARGRRRPDQQLEGPGRDARQARRAVPRLRCSGRTMYVVPFSMGPLGSPLSYIGVEITDSPYVAVSMRIDDARRPGRARRARRRRRVRALRALARRAARRRARPTCAWPCNPDEKWIVHFPETREIWSYGSGYGGNALLGKKCFALRIASVIARDEGWLAEHMLVLKLTSPDGLGALHRRRVPVGVRQDQPRHARPDRSRAGRSRPSATTSRG